VRCSRQQSKADWGDGVCVVECGISGLVGMGVGIKALWVSKWQPCQRGRGVIVGAEVFGVCAGR